MDKKIPPKRKSKKNLDFYTKVVCILKIKYFKVGWFKNLYLID
ncbi:hypothetical protein SOI71_01710 [Acinetobacter pittii]|nr:hypothetical protein [Acinetobacter pittii]WPP77594.1 hypothetical protein SOI71_01710 [Acinetobacter pittii]